MEIERKFLLPELPVDVAEAPSTHLRQGYLAIGPHDEVRIRDAGGVFTLTAKSGAGIEREESETEITRAQFEALWASTEGRRIEKRRHLLAEGDVTYEVDVFEGSLQGLLLAEVEFHSLDEARSFEPPAWFGPEVTHDIGYSNAALAVRGLRGGTPA
ncbi:MAG: CYTH domain-containing protein [Coriobacteriia bacterium]|jgi:CYTH domain-containing protein